MKKLKVIAGKDRDKGREFPLPASGALVIGRALDTHTQFVDQLISGTHCRVEVNGDAVYLIDNHSSNGTFLGPTEDTLTRVEPNRPVEIQNGQLIRLGNDTVLEYVDDAIHVMRTQRADDAMKQRLGIGQQHQAEERRRPQDRATQPMPALGTMPPNPLGGGIPDQQPPNRLPPGALSVNCSHCGQQLVAREQYAGMQVRCPTCRNLVTLPGRPGSTPPAAVSTPPSQQMPALPLIGSSGNMPALPGMPLPPGSMPGMPGLPSGPMVPPSVDAFQMPYGQQSRPWRPIHLVLLTIPVVLLVVALVVAIKLLLN